MTLIRSILSTLLTSHVVDSKAAAARHFGPGHTPADVAYNCVTNAYHSRITRAVVFAGQPV